MPGADRRRMQTWEAVRIGSVIAICQAQVVLCLGQVVIRGFGIRAACQECNPSSELLPVGGLLFYSIALVGLLRDEIPRWAWKMIAFAAGFHILLTISAFTRGYRCLFCTIAALLTLAALMSFSGHLSGPRLRIAMGFGILVGAGASLMVLQ